MGTSIDDILLEQAMQEQRDDAIELNKYELEDLFDDGFEEPSVDLNQVEIIEVDTQTFARDYEFVEWVKDNDNTVFDPKTGKIYLALYKGDKVQLAQIANMDAIAKIQEGMKDFRQMLIDQGFGKDEEK